MAINIAATVNARNFRIPPCPNAANVAKLNTLKYASAPSIAVFSKPFRLATRVDRTESLVQSMIRGVNILAKAVVTTLGPKGRNVVLEKKFGAPQITKDGVTVAKDIELSDPYKNMGAQMVREIASTTPGGGGRCTAIRLMR